MGKIKNNQNKNSFFDWRILALLGVLVFVGHLGVIFLFTLGQNYGRMNKDEAVNIYEMKMPDSVKNAVPINSYAAVLNIVDPEGLKNPLPFSQEKINLGQTYYTYYCIQCHGSEADGRGTVGQSFSPLPANLRGSYVRNQSDGRIFKNISLGYKRHPPLAYTVSEEERWAIILYIRSLSETER